MKIRMEFTLAFKHHVKTPTTRNILFNSGEADERLVAKLDYCGTPAPWGWNFCRTAGCQRCRKYRAQDWVSEAQKLFMEVPKDNLRWVTTMLRPCATLNEVVAEVKSGKVAWRNIVFRLRRADARAMEMRAYGFAEVDWYQTAHVGRLGTTKQLQIEGLGYDEKAPEVWFPHFHLLVNLGTLPERKLLEALQRKWEEPRLNLVNIKPLHSWQTKAEAITSCLEYAAKFKHYYKIDPFWPDARSVTWDRSAVVRYYNMLNGIGGFSLQRFHLKPAKQKAKEQDMHGGDSAMPVAFI